MLRGTIHYEFLLIRKPLSLQVLIRQRKHAKFRITCTVCENFDLGDGCLIYPCKMPIEYFILETFILPNCYRHLFICAYMCRFRIFPGMGVREITMVYLRLIFVQFEFSKRGRVMTFPFSDPRIGTKPMN